MLKRVFHMVFNSCGKLVGKCWNLHRFSIFCAVYAAHGVFYSCGKAKSGRSGKESKVFRFFRLSSTFPQEFSTHNQKFFLKSKNRSPSHQKGGERRQTNEKSKPFPSFFPHFKKKNFGQKVATYHALGAFPQSPQTLLILLIIHYIILSL